MKDFTENAEDENDGESPDFEIFQVKFLGSTVIDAPKSEEATANAIKHIITTAKGKYIIFIVYVNFHTFINSNVFFIISASNKKLQRINLSICPKGIETFDAITGETLHQVSIYKISYCSADAAHSNVFAFIGGTGVGSATNIANDENDTLTCYAFICAKRKIAHNLTLTVAKNFQCAYDLWKKSEQTRKLSTCEEATAADQQSLKICENNINLDKSDCVKTIKSDQMARNLLIDFSSDISLPNNAEHQRKLLQKTWVSFDDEPQICEDGALTSSKIYENRLWEKNLICS